VTETLDNLSRVLGEFVPRLLGAVVILAAAFLVALLLQRFLAGLLDRAGLDELFERTGASESLWRLGYGGGPSRLLGTVAFWGVLLAGLAGALSALGLSSLEQTMEGVVNLSGRALISLSILIAGVMSAGWLSQLVAREAESAGLRGSGGFRRVVFGFVLSVAALLAASQLGLETSVLVLLSLVVLATVGLAAALAVGPGLVPLSGNIAAGRYVQEGISVGDEIEVQGIEGRVEELGHASLTLRSEDGYLYRVPNRTLLEAIVRKRAPSGSPEE
jgi:small-conductance mechanosensitive channel